MVPRLYRFFEERKPANYAHFPSADVSIDVGKSKVEIILFISEYELIVHLSEDVVASLDNSGIIITWSAFSGKVLSQIRTEGIIIAKIDIMRS